MVSLPFHQGAIFCLKALKNGESLEAFYSLKSLGAHQVSIRMMGVVILVVALLLISMKSIFGLSILFFHAFSSSVRGSAGDQGSRGIAFECCVRDVEGVTLSKVTPSRSFSVSVLVSCKFNFGGVALRFSFLSA